MGIALEADLGRRVDAALALAMLNGLAAKTEARTIAVCVSRSNIPDAQLADVIVGFYSPRPVGGSAMIGMPESPAAPDDAPVTATLGKKNAEGAPVYSSNIKGVLDTADNAVLIRNMLLAQNDGNATVVVAGPLTGIARLLNLFGAKPQIATKVKQLVVAAGAFPAAAAEASIKADVAAARDVFANWPTPIIAAGSEVGEAFAFPGASIDRDFAWAPAHPVADFYRSFKTMPYDAPSTALAGLLYATHPDDGFFKLSEPGTIGVQDDGRTRLAPAADGKHRYLIADTAGKDKVVGLFTALASAQPAPRPGRGRGGDDDLQFS
jgi:inosine-uridine nucleoside N-ribohydrolase